MGELTALQARLAAEVMESLRPSGPETSESWRKEVRTWSTRKLERELRKSVREMKNFGKSKSDGK